MPHSEKVSAHAERQLAGEGRTIHPGQLAARLPFYRRFLKIENHRLRLAHQAGGGGRDLCRRRVSLLDIFLRYLFTDACEACLGTTDPTRSELALLAIGGYGRGELNPYSDVDVMFLHHHSAEDTPPHINEIIRQILYVLWDIGFKVGHATRSIAEACEQANRDNVSKTALFEARFIVGQGELLDEFRAQFERECLLGQEQAYFAWRVEDQRTRHQKYGPTVFLQEPNVKSSPGGLRDYQNLLWTAYLRERVSTVRGLAERSLINDTERRTLDRAYDFLLRVRTDLHYLAGRSADSLALNIQGQIAERLHYPQKNDLRRTEAFMRDYYQHARGLFLVTETLFERLIQDAVPNKPHPTGPLRLFAPEGPTVERFDGFVTHEGLIYPETHDVFDRDPFRLLRVFEHAQLRDLKLSPEVERLIRRRLWLINRTFQYSRTARETFTAILSRPGKVGAALRSMHECDVLGAYMPEFGELTCLVQHEFFHRYSADEHTLVCLEKLDSLYLSEGPQFANYRRLFEKLDDPFVLYLAMLLHDTGKATSARHHAEASAIFAQRVANRLQLSGERRSELILLVDHHMTLSSTAQRRNLDDPATIAEFASVVKQRTNLDALMLLTLADGQGTSDDNWSDWKESLVWQLYRSTKAYLVEGESAYRLSKRQRDNQRLFVAETLDPSYRDEIEAHFQYMPERYFETFDANAIVEHLRLSRLFLARRSGHDEAEAALAPAIRWIPRPDRGHTECWVVNLERYRLLAKIAGSFSAAGLNILSADIYTRQDNLVFDVFRVTSPFGGSLEARDMSAVESTLRQSLLVQSFDFEPLLQKARRRRRAPVPVLLNQDFPTRTVITNEATDRYTLIEVQTPDRLGLLFELLRALGRADINVILARIATDRGAAIDAFYVTDRENGRIVDPVVIKRVQDAVQRAATAKVP